MATKIVGKLSWQFCKLLGVLACHVHVENKKSRVGCMSLPKLVVEDEEVFSLIYKVF